MGIFSWFRRPTPESVGHDIMLKIARRSFAFFQQQRFRALVGFEKLEQIEQDRIFNELVVTGLVLSYLMFETITEMSRDAKKDFFQIISRELFGSYPRYLKKLGVEKQYTDLWYQLMAQRCEEYRADFRRQKKYLPSAKQSNPWIPVVSIGALFHIRRGKPLKEDPLFELLHKWCTDIAIGSEKIVIKAIDRLA